jgi:predicted RNA-binding Zn-ribbon protein involved in translation (DUF1610 family)
MPHISENEVEKLKDCPFCGSSDILRKFTDNGEHEEAECSDCGAEHNIGMWQIRYAQSAPVDLERVQKTLVLLFPFDRMEHTEAQKTMELMESMGLVFMRETDSDFEQEEYGDYVWLLTEKGSALLPTPSKE